MSLFLVVQLPSHVWLFVIPWTVACQAFLSLTYSLSIPKSMPIAVVMPSTISSSDTLLSFYPQFFPASVTFTMRQLFASNDQNTGASVSASVLPMSIQGSFPLRLTGLISLLSKGLSGVFSITTVWITNRVDHNKLWKSLKEIGIPDHLICLLRSLYSGQETTVRTNRLVPNRERSTSRLYIVILLI